MLDWSSLRRPILMLAPMAGFTDSPYRQMVKEICPEVVCFTEFTSTDGLSHGNAASRRHVCFSENERPIVAQIFGKKPEKFAETAKILTKMGVDAIDINMGCPARKIVSSDHGSALLKNPRLAFEIVEAASKATSLPVSVKMRIGTSKYDPDYFFNFVRNIEKAGAKLLTIHGRTAKQMYSGLADWNPIYEAKKLLKIPVIGNGDIKNGEDAVSKLGNLDGIMVGRACMGNPWIFMDIHNAFEGSKKIGPLSFSAKIPWIKKHLRASCEFKGEKYGIREMRKHLAYYVRGLRNAAEIRRKLMTIETEKEAVEAVENLRVFA